MPDESINLVCCACGHRAAPTDWRCPVCASPLEIETLPPFDADAIRAREWSLWRYAAMLPTHRRFSLGEGMTPLIPVNTGDGAPFLAKLEYLNPTSSYKDRGSAVLLNYLLGQDVEAVIEDSSGNAGASIAAYAAGIGMRARIFVPAAAPAAKKGMIARFGAEVVEIGGTRADVTTAVEAAAAGMVYASHAWNPLFIAGQMTNAWEIWEQMSQRAPTAVVCPIGQGLLFLGLYRGFRALLDAGLIDRMPRLFGAQSAAYDPIVRAVEGGAEDVAPSGSGQTVADGIQIARPLRGKAILAAMRETEGGAFRAGDQTILAAQTTLARRGLFVEPTSATAVAVLPQVRAVLDGPAEIVVPLTGNGLKTNVEL